jgi:L-threonylcarbamoyladenylate synthase
MQTKNVSIKENVINDAVEILRKSGVVAFPTETVYGLGCSYSDETAIKKIYDIKGRSFTKPLAAHIASLEQVAMLCQDIPESFYKLAEIFLPGPLSIVLNKKPFVSDMMTAGLNTLAIRFPKNDAALKLINAFGSPLAATSANISGGKSPYNALQVAEQLNGRIQLIIDGGETEEKTDSTVISLAGEPSLLRQGAVPVSEIEAIIGPIAVL